MDGTGVKNDGWFAECWSERRCRDEKDRKGFTQSLKERRAGVRRGRNNKRGLTRASRGSRVQTDFDVISARSMVSGPPKTRTASTITRTDECISKAES